jgi:hypothetical protein
MPSQVSTRLKGLRLSHHRKIPICPKCVFLTIIFIYSHLSFKHLTVNKSFFYDVRFANREKIMKLFNLKKLSYSNSFGRTVSISMR